MTTDTRVPLARAQVIAWTVEAELRPFCERIEVAGSIRRRRESVKDVEILAVPRDGRADFFGQSISDSLADYLQSQIGRGRWALRPNVRGATSFGALNKLMLYDGFPVDIFTATVENWGRDLMVRTGGAEWNRQIMRRFNDLGHHGHAYGPHAVTYKDGTAADAPDEAAMFRLLGWDYTPPESRQ